MYVFLYIRSLRALSFASLRFFRCLWYAANSKASATAAAPPIRLQTTNAP